MRAKLDEVAWQPVIIRSSKPWKYSYPIVALHVSFNLYKKNCYSRHYRNPLTIRNKASTSMASDAFSDPDPTGQRWQLLKSRALPSSSNCYAADALYQAADPRSFAATYTKAKELLHPSGKPFLDPRIRLQFSMAADPPRAHHRRRIETKQSILVST